MLYQLSAIPVYIHGERGVLIDEGNNVEFHPDKGGHIIYNPLVDAIVIDTNDLSRLRD